MTESNQNNRKNGLQRIAASFEFALKDQSAALMPYFTLGYPDIESSLRIISNIAPYSDLLELGIPFSDPIADGPTIQRSTQRALENGVTASFCLDMVHKLRTRGVDCPILLMGYYNPILAYGENEFVYDAASVGVDGIIVPDLPPEEAGTLRAAALKQDIALIFFLTPTSNNERVKYITTLANGFIYMVSLTGVTGARTKLATDLSSLVYEVRQYTTIPIAVGFGISTPDQASAVAHYSDGVIIGSALIDVVDKASDQVTAAVSYISGIKQALRQSEGDSAPE